MESLPARGRVYVACAALAAALCLVPLRSAHPPWWAVALLAGLYAGGGRVAARGRLSGTFYPVLLAGAFLLPAPAAALVAVPGALLGPVGRRPRGPRRLWRASQLVLAVSAAAGVYGTLGEPDAVTASEFPARSPPPGPPSSRSAWSSPCSTAAS